MNNQREIISEEYPDLLFCDGYDDCIMGVVDRCGSNSCVCYDVEKIVSKLLKEGMTEEEAYEYFNFNIVGAYVGEFTPCFMSLKLKEDTTCPESKVIVT